jgi:hypothetical protein
MLMETCALIFGTRAKDPSNAVAPSRTFSPRICDPLKVSAALELREIESYREQFSNSSYHKDVRLVPRILPTMPELLSTWPYVIYYSDVDHPGLSNMRHVLCWQCDQCLATPPGCCRRRRLIHRSDVFMTVGTLPASFVSDVTGVNTVTAYLEGGLKGQGG